MSKIVKVKKNSDGDITDVMFDNGNTCPISQAIIMAKDGLIEGVNIGKAKNGREYLKVTAIDNVGGRNTISHWGSVRDWMPLTDVAYYGILHFDGRFGYSFKKGKNHKSVLKLAQ